ncbi:MAG TPA: pyridine nucleotide-disulfide oxidoreductase, partial [Spirochaetales bacterium]|nr:pyridine nucleotide-disulfide oxidoreductase [Spirochaetales bacterium]
AQAVAASGVVEVAEAVSAASGDWAEPAAEAVTAVSSAVAEAVTAASGEWTDAAAGAVQTVTVGVADAGTKALGKVWDLTKPIFNPSSPLVTWFRTTFMDGLFSHLPFELFQLMIVVMEIVIGLALFGGAFTWFAAVASIAMCVIFTLSGMFAWDQLWFVFAAILMMGGLGRAFGMDYWIVPFFKKWWNGTKLARRSHLYADDPSK